MRAQEQECPASNDPANPVSDAERCMSSARAEGDKAAAEYRRMIAAGFVAVSTAEPGTNPIYLDDDRAWTTDEEDDAAIPPAGQPVTIGPLVGVPDNPVSSIYK